MYEAFTLNPSASSMTCIPPDTSEPIPSLAGVTVTVCPSIFSRGIGSLTVGGLYPINEEDQTALGSSKAIFDWRLQPARNDRNVRVAGKLDNRILLEQQSLASFDGNYAQLCFNRDGECFHADHR